MLFSLIFFFFLLFFFFFFFQAEDGIRDSSTSRGLGDVYKRQVRVMNETKQQPMQKKLNIGQAAAYAGVARNTLLSFTPPTTCTNNPFLVQDSSCLLYTSDAADDTPCVDLGGRRIIKKKKKKKNL
ncbi:phage protein [Lactobacillus rhamnosus GG] [Lacticaseibacillus rhamnosus]|nr:phage protein [Lactobacillus rhamnosus GG] [Lacticaseibacillus rhamnosus]